MNCDAVYVAREDRKPIDQEQRPDYNGIRGLLLIMWLSMPKSITGVQHRHEEPKKDAEPWLLEARGKGQSI